MPPLQTDDRQQTRRQQTAGARWLYEARKRYGLCVLDYTVTCNHIHLVVRDQGRGEIAQRNLERSARAALMSLYGERASWIRRRMG